MGQDKAFIEAKNKQKPKKQNKKKEGEHTIH